MKRSGKIIFVLLLSFALISLSGCFGKETASDAGGKKSVEANNKPASKAKETNQTTKKVTETTGSVTTDDHKVAANTTEQSAEKSSKKTSENSTNKPTDKTTKNSNEKTTEKPTEKTDKNQNVGEKEVVDFVLTNTKIVQISSISKRSKEQHPDLGPFFVVRGIDLRGEVSEVWIKDLKIFEMETQAN
ncbi:preprotein translocase subunit SecF [Bacillus sp. SORGH_AS 510]|uniref:hypothetical protein n=1 Tax=Bacillus sp. SORGH_AS_0510 TaxID=3041771 RepID=UPI00277D230D|nr:hypothetical protein [Bacillus sp. SORGH_AS_0510]MDQ1144160.1 preprotein translocase subunit SecF [Bacillus sp. SORGH_AS_0510]